MPSGTPVHEPQPSPTIRTIDPGSLFREIVSGREIFVIDVREAAEVERSRKRFPGAIEIPIHQLFLRRSELPIETKGTIVAVSNHGRRAAAAVLTLSLLGAADPRALEGGLDAWEQKRLPLE